MPLNVENENQPGCFALNHTRKSRGVNIFFGGESAYCWSFVCKYMRSFLRVFLWIYAKFLKPRIAIGPEWDVSSTWVRTNGLAVSMCSL